MCGAANNPSSGPCNSTGARHGAVYMLRMDVGIGVVVGVWSRYTVGVGNYRMGGIDRAMTAAAKPVQ